MEVGATPLRIQVVSDGRAGMENQALGLAEAIARLRPATIDVRRVRWRRVFDALPVWAKRDWMLDPTSDPVFPAPGAHWPQLWIATGRATLPLSLWARRRSGGRTFVVQTQDPRLDPGRFDLVIAPAHDRLSGPNVVQITGSTHRITTERLAKGAPAFADRLEPLPQPRLAVLIGGRSASFDLPVAHAAVLAERIGRAVETAGGSVMLSFSRRTPEAAKAAFRDRLSGLPGLIWDGEGDNPLFAMLHVADHILVTEDSASMAAEAASTGRPVHVLPMIGRRPAGKFARLHAELAARGATRPFNGALPIWTYAPLDETARAARAVLDAMAARSA